MQMVTMAAAALVPPPEDREATRLIFKKARTERNAKGQMVVSERIPMPERQIIESRRKVLAQCLEPARPTDVKAVVQQMMAGFPSTKGISADEAKVIVTQYVRTLAGLPLFAISAACLRFARGDVAAEELGEKLPLMGREHPSTGHLYRVAEAECRAARDEARLAEMLLTAEVYVSPVKKGTEEERAAFAKRIVSEVAAGMSATIGAEEAERAARRAENAVRAAHRTRAEILDDYAARGVVPVFSDEAKRTPVAIETLLSLGWEIVEVGAEKVLTKRTGGDHAAR